MHKNPFTFVGRYFMMRKLKRGMRRDGDDATDAMMRASNFNFADSDRFVHEDEFMAAMSRRSRKEKLFNRLGGNDAV